jgi:excisionase family DNA binding protein
MAPSGHAQRLLDVNEVADRMGVTVRFVRRLVAQRRLPYRKLGKFVRFEPTEVEDWLEARRVDPIHGSLERALGRRNPAR